MVKSASSSQQQCTAKPHFISGVENIPPTLQTQLELEFQDLEQWVIGNLRESIVEAELALKQGNTAAGHACEFNLYVHVCS